MLRAVVAVGAVGVVVEIYAVSLNGVASLFVGCHHGFWVHVLEGTVVVSVNVLVDCNLNVNPGSSHYGGLYSRATSLCVY